MLRTSRKADEGAVAALVLALVALVVPIIPSVAAIWLGVSARRRIRASGGELGGETLATIAMVVAVSELVLIGALVLFGLWIALQVRG